jgi:hypothetical protein
VSVLIVVEVCRYVSDSRAPLRQGPVADLVLSGLEEVEIVDRMETGNDMGGHAAGQEDVVSDIPLGGDLALHDSPNRRAARGRLARADRGEAATVSFASNGRHRILGPFVHRNLAGYVVHCAAQTGAETYLTLEEGLERKTVVVHETGDVGELAVENLSETKLLIQAGDIVKGGKQDRVLAYDLILAPRSGRVSIKSFCVESGRWSARGDEHAEYFESAPAMVASKGGKFAFRTGYSRSQNAVWSEVAEVQRKLSSQVEGSVHADVSPTSLQLTLEDKRVKATADEYIEALEKNGASPDAVGYVFAVNGEVNSGDVYSSPALFRKLWPKLLRASAVEAAADLQEGDAPPPPTVEAVLGFLAHPSSGEGHRTPVSDQTTEVMLEYGRDVLYESRDQAAGGTWFRRSYIRRDPPEGRR